MIWLWSARQTLRYKVLPEIALRPRAECAEVRRPRPSLLARLRKWATDGHWEREGKIKGAARDIPVIQHPCGFAAARCQGHACRRVHCHLGRLWRALEQRRARFGQLEGSNGLV